MDCDGLSEDFFRVYTSEAELERVKTSNMGTLYELDYKVILMDEHKSSSFWTSSEAETEI